MKTGVCNFKSVINSYIDNIISILREEGVSDEIICKAFNCHIAPSLTTGLSSNSSQTSKTSNYDGDDDDRDCSPPKRFLKRKDAPKDIAPKKTNIDIAFVTYSQNCYALFTSEKPPEKLLSLLRSLPGVSYNSKLKLGKGWAFRKSMYESHLPKVEKAAGVSIPVYTYDEYEALISGKTKSKEVEEKQHSDEEESTPFFVSDENLKERMAFVTYSEKHNALLVRDDIPEDFLAFMELQKHIVCRSHLKLGEGWLFGVNDHDKVAELVEKAVGGSIPKYTYKEYEELNSQKPSNETEEIQSQNESSDKNSSKTQKPVDKKTRRRVKKYKINKWGNAWDPKNELVFMKIPVDGKTKQVAIATQVTDCDPDEYRELDSIMLLEDKDIELCEKSGILYLTEEIVENIEDEVLAKTLFGLLNEEDESDEEEDESDEDESDEVDEDESDEYSE